MQLPYGLTREALSIDVGASSNSTEVRHALKSMVDDSAGPDEEEALRRVGYSTMLLLLHNVGATFAECLDTAIIWECG